MNQVMNCTWYSHWPFAQQTKIVILCAVAAGKSQTKRIDMFRQHTGLGNDNGFVVQGKKIIQHVTGGGRVVEDSHVGIQANGIIIAVGEDIIDRAELGSGIAGGIAAEFGARPDIACDGFGRRD